MLEIVHLSPDKSPKLFYAGLIHAVKTSQEPEK